MNRKLILLLTFIAVMIVSCKKTDTSQEKPREDSVAVVVADTAQTTQHLSEWEGEYKGITPCEDCDGVETALTLNFDSTFTQSLRYIGKGGPYESGGTFSLDETSGTVTLKFDDGSQAKYRVGESTLSLLNEDGSTIEGEDYVLRK